MTLIAWAPTVDGLAYHDELQALARRRPALVYWPVLDAAGDVTDRRTLLDAVERHAPPDGACVVYVAGGERTIKRVRELLMARGLDRKSVKWERFW